MFPIVTRVFWLLVQPVSLVALFVLLGLILSFRRGRWWGRVMTLLGLMVLCIMAFSTFGYALIAPLEQRFVRPQEPAHIDGIVVLGGGLNGRVDTARQSWELNASGDRLVETLRLALAHPDARIIVAGGQAALAADEEPETDGAKRFFAAFGIAAERLAFDDRSRNTEENAQFAKTLAGDTTGQTWLLVTSAYHMPRAMGLFRKAGFAVTPWPTDYFAGGKEGLRIKPDEASENIAVTNLAVREWLGLLGYKWTGRIDDVLPGP